MFRRLLALLFVVALLPAGTKAQSYKEFKYQDGDLLFQDLDCGGLCDAIEKVTNSINGKHFSHIGLVYNKDGSFFVIEAIGKDVHLTPIDDFINRQKDAQGNPKIVVGRLRGGYSLLNKPAIDFALKQLGKPYDEAFLYGNGKYYCSELIYDAYKTANRGNPFFQLAPMTFKDPSTGKTFPAWVDYYKELKMPIPEGRPGCNPGGISTSDKVVILASFY